MLKSPQAIADTAATEQDGDDSKRHTLPALEPGSVTARALYRTWSGDECVVVQSPPGGGKTTMTTTVLAHLAMRSGLHVVAATPTNAQKLSLAERLATMVPEGVVRAKIKFSEETPDGVNVKRGKDDNRLPRIEVRTVASCAYSSPECDVLVVDEAYQATFQQVASAANKSEQLLMVGDPGQIGPVVTSPVGAFAPFKVKPYARAPEVFASNDDTSRLRIGRTFRLGGQTVEVIKHLYDFPFTSQRPDRNVDNRPEIETVQVAPASEPDDDATLHRVVRQALTYVGSTVHEANAAADAWATRTVRGRDVAIIAARNSQVTTISAMLRSMGMGDVDVGTADRLQGGEWDCVVALDPLFGSNEVSGHSASLGRTCVMLSRHRVAMTWIHDGNHADKLDSDDTEQVAGLQVRNTLAAVAGNS